MTKVCTRCKDEKPLTEYYTENRTFCNDCERATARERMASPENKAKNAYRNAKKAAEKYGVYDDLSEDDVLYLFAIADGKCAYTGEKSDNLSLEHVIPLSLQGPNTISNLLVVDLSANKKKHDDNLIDFLWEHGDRYNITELIRLLATRGNRDFDELFKEIERHHVEESREQYERIMEKVNAS